MSTIIEKKTRAFQPELTIKRIHNLFDTVTAQLRQRLNATPAPMTTAPIRGLLMSTDQLEQRIRDLAETHGQVMLGSNTRSLMKLLNQQERVLRQAFKAFSAEGAQPMATPAAEWLLGNMHVIIDQIREVRQDLPGGYYSELPKLTQGPQAGLPRIYALAIELIEHTDGRLAQEQLVRCVMAYQSKLALSIGEVWAIPIMLRLGLIENLGRLAQLTLDAHRLRIEADSWANKLLVQRSIASFQSDPVFVELAHLHPQLLLPFVVQLLQNLRGYEGDFDDRALINWLEQHHSLPYVSVEDLFKAEQQRQSTNQISVANSITSMRTLNAIDWQNWFERVSLIEQMLRQDPEGVYARSTFATRDHYRHKVETLAKRSGLSEDMVARRLVAAAYNAEQSAQPAFMRHIGYYLIDQGREVFEHSIGARPRPGELLERMVLKHPTAFYLGGIAMASAASMALGRRLVYGEHTLQDGAQQSQQLSTIFMLLPASAIAVELMNRLVSRIVKPRVLPRLNLKDGIPEDLRTMVVVPTLLLTTDSVHHQLEALEVLYLANADRNLHFALLSDFADAPSPSTDDDEIVLDLAIERVRTLNQRYGEDRFFLLHRRRVWNDKQGRWMGWERKRGKLEEFNRLLTGAKDTTFDVQIGHLDTFPLIRYVITLDSDTQLPRDVASALVGTMAHPLNHAYVNPHTKLVNRGYGIMQPRVGIDVPSATASRFARIFSGNVGIDPYTTAVSDVYMDLFAEGIYAGKGIYDPVAFRESVDHRFPENTLLSHDLIEGSYARAALLSDVQLLDGYPTTYAAHAARQHRWVRGDWQIARWLLPRVPNSSGQLVPNRLPLMARYRIFDNLRRSLVPPATAAMLLAGWLGLGGRPAAWTALALGQYAVPLGFEFFDLLSSLRSLASFQALPGNVYSLRQSMLRTMLNAALLPDQARLNIDAIIRTLLRVLLTHSNMLEWETAAQSQRRLISSEGYLERTNRPAVTAVALATLLRLPDLRHMLPASAPIAILWSIAPKLAGWLDKPYLKNVNMQLNEADSALLLDLARRTWSFFDTYSLEENNYLAPDNIQETPSLVVANRTSPTNIGLQLLANLSAYDFGFIGLTELIERTERVFASIERLDRFRGHLLNWYDTRTMRPLTPQYVSTVDSGNLAGHLLTLRQGLLGLREQALTAEIASTEQTQSLHARLEILAEQCMAWVQEMDFRFLYDEQRHIFTIGYNLTDNRRDNSYYDLLASEARLASFIAIATGDVPQEHWFHIGRTLTPVTQVPTLITWSGTMFEYLMPLLVMRSYPETLLASTYQGAVARQIAYAQQKGVPWGISESAYNMRDLAMNYQYRAFGVPGLGLQSGLGDDLVIAPYASVLALAIAPEQVLSNIRKLIDLGALGEHGLYEAIDYTAARLAPGSKHAIIRSFMVHHQAMSLLAIGNLLHNNLMPSRFHAEPLVQATEMLLHEKIPTSAPLNLPEDTTSTPTPVAVTGNPTRTFTTANTAVPYSHILASGNHSVLLTNAGGGFSHNNGLAVTRWRADTTLDNWGSFIYVRDSRSGMAWSPTLQPLGVTGEGYRAIYDLEKVEYSQVVAGIDTRLEVTISPEDHTEVRRLTLVNLTSAPRELEVTSYAEIVLMAAEAEAAHPAFANLFIETEYVDQHATLLASRRPRSDNAKRIYAAHTLAVRGFTIGEIEYESSRLAFLGRGRTHARPVALEYPLSGTTGAVLDPIFSMRRRIRVAPGSSATIIFSTAIANDREDALSIAERYRDPVVAARAFEMAWTQSRVELRHMNISADDAHRFQRLISLSLYPDRVRRAAAEQLERNTSGQSSLWAYGISGDYPIILARMQSDDLGLLRELIQALEYWRLKGLMIDLVLLNDDASSYRQERQDQLLSMVRSSPVSRWLNERGGIFILRRDLLTDVDEILLESVASVVLSNRRGNLGQQLRRRSQDIAILAPVARTAPIFPSAPISNITLAEAMPETANLILWNGYGGFSQDGREYVMLIDTQNPTPAPWSNVIANEHGGFLVSERGASMTWAENSRENRLTPWSNDPVSDQSGEAIYLRDEVSGAVWSPAPEAAGVGQFQVRHGFGYSSFSHMHDDIGTELCLSLAPDAAVKLLILKLENHGDSQRQLSVSMYVEWVLGVLRESMSPYIITSLSTSADGRPILLARNPYNQEFAGRMAFLAASQPAMWATGDRAAFLGRNGSRARPALLELGLPGQAQQLNLGAGYDACGVLRCAISLQPGEQQEIVFSLGQGQSEAQALELAQYYTQPEAAHAASAITRQLWEQRLSAVQVRTPQPELDVMLNGWLLYQALVCRYEGRSALYQSGGAYGYRDQLQDVMAFLHSTPDIAREHILRAASRQFVEGDVQHWWHPPSGRGIRTAFSDDYLWLVFVVDHYVNTTGDTGILDQHVSFLEGRALKEDEAEYYDLPQISQQQANLYEHCVRAIEYGLHRRGAHNLPLMGAGDWNDGMNMVGHAGQGESVWVGWFLSLVLERFAAWAEQRGDSNRAARYRKEASSLKAAIEEHAWDGNWYLRAFYDDGTAMGSSQSDECQIDSLVQSWAVIAAGDQQRAYSAMQQVDRQLVDRELQLIRLFRPAFDKSSQNPGYIKGYVPGVRENGGQYTHAAIWVAWAFAELGDAQRASELVNMLNPVGHSLRDPQRYMVEPYVIAADIYTAKGHEGRGGWTWYTGSASWYYRLILEKILGLQRLGNSLLIQPCLPPEWPGYSMRYRYGNTHYAIYVERGDRPSISLDGRALEADNIPLIDDGQAHEIRVVLKS